MDKIQLWSIQGNRQKLDGGAMFGHAPKALWSQWISPDEDNRITLCCRALLIKIHQKYILCETGIGAFFEPKLKSRYGVIEDQHVLLSSLFKIGLKDTDISYVVLSHLHFDHAGGLLPAYNPKNDGPPTNLLFPNATYLVGQEAFERAKKPHDRDKASFISFLPNLLINSSRLTIVENQILPSFFPNHIEFRFSEGHTSGQMHLLLKGKDRSLFFAADLIPGVPWIHSPICMGYDRFPEKLIEEKNELYNSVDKKTMLFFTHDPNYSAATIVKNKKQKYEPYEKIPELMGEVL